MATPFIAFPNREQLATREGLESWLITQPRDVVVAIAARTALRVVPLYGIRRNTRSLEFSRWTLGLFWAAAVALFAAKYKFRENALTLAAPGVAFSASEASSKILPGYFAALSVNFASSAAFSVGTDVVRLAVDAVYSAADAAASPFSEHDNKIPASSSASAILQAAAADAMRLVEEPNSLGSLIDSQLWPDGVPGWVQGAWVSLQALLPTDENWTVWFDWYSERIGGARSRGEDYEVVFARLPLAEWEKGPAVANAWIAAQLTTADPAPQRPALYSFVPTGGQIDIAERRYALENPKASLAFLEEAKRVISELRTRLYQSNNPVRGLSSTLDRLDRRLSDGLNSIEIGFLVASHDALEGLRSAIDSSEGRAEYSLEDIAGVFELRSLVRRLISQFADGREILISEAALGISTPQAAQAIDAAVEAVTIVAASSPLVTPAVPAALREPIADIADAPNAFARIRLSALRFLTTENFVAAVDTLSRLTAVGAVGAVAVESLPALASLIDGLGAALEHAADVLGRDGAGIRNVLLGAAAVVAALRKNSRGNVAPVPAKPAAKRSRKPAAKSPRKPEKPRQPEG